MLIHTAGIIADALANEGTHLTGVITDVIERNVVLVRTSNGVIRALNYSLPARIGLPVVVEFRASAWVVTGLDHLAMPSLGNVHYVPGHHDAHEFAREGGGDDVVWLKKEQYTPLLVAPTVPPSLWVRVFPSTVIGKDLRIRQLLTVMLVDLQPHIGESTRYVLVCFNLETCLPEAVSSEFIPEIPVGSVPLALIRLTPGATSVGWQDILDIRELPPTLAPIALEQIQEVAGRLNSIRRIALSGIVSLYEATDSGLVAALSDAVAGDRVITPTAEFSANITVPAGVMLDFANSVFSGTISGDGIVKNYQEP